GPGAAVGPAVPAVFGPRGAGFQPALFGRQAGSLPHGARTTNLGRGRDVMAGRVTPAVDTPGGLCPAPRARAAPGRRPGARAGGGGSVAELVNGILRQALAAEIDEVTGTPPLAAVIQAHHDRRLREDAQGPTGPP